MIWDRPLGLMSQLYGGLGGESHIEEMCEIEGVKHWSSWDTNVLALYFGRSLSPNDQHSSRRLVQEMRETPGISLVWPAPVLFAEFLTGLSIIRNAPRLLLLLWIPQL